MRILASAVIVLLATANGAVAQLKNTKADITALVENDIAPGSGVRAALQVRLPAQLHVQSNKPRDPSLIPTVLTVSAPAGVRVAEIVFPKPTDLAQEGQTEPLAVFENEFAIGVRFDVASSVAAGALEIPARLRYQACDEHLCYAPTSANVVWTVNVGA
jgi:thioredoxin:protein disulfide reductase